MRKNSRENEVDSRQEASSSRDENLIVISHREDDEKVQEKSVCAKSLYMKNLLKAR